MQNVLIISCAILILKELQTNYYNHYFEANCNSIKNTWKGIKSILNIKNTSTDITKTLTVDGTTISFSHKHFSDFLNNRSNIFFFISPTDKTEIENVLLQKCLPH